MLEFFVLIFCSGLVEVIHVELSDEGLELVVFEILWQDLPLESLRVLDDEAVLLVVPDDYFAVLGILN